eukprot:CAMPEP_0178429228 /NCGR_PEP_ID=MMETSP0689_2-20121128/30693_1 /TAXON_ID=160604 /ORGANISM="Amphidinium massartii, Strain CS-259" /LENGTH=82 /DNA_ID=CAMNT_0020051041 /DNA_START=555 /DNA_END=803 /DNA_ORIENTATION=+
MTIIPSLGVNGDSSIVPAGTHSRLRHMHLNASTWHSGGKAGIKRICRVILTSSDREAHLSTSSEVDAPMTHWRVSKLASTTK